MAGLTVTHEQALAGHANADLVASTSQSHDVAAATERAVRQDERSESADLGRGALFGSLTGVVVGAVTGVGLVYAAVPQNVGMGSTEIVLGVLIGAFWGSFFGGLGGMVLKVLGHAEH